MREEDWVDLVASIEAGKCILMLGPDAVTELSEGERVPVMTLLSRELKRYLDGDDRLLDDANFTAVAQAVSRTEGSDGLTELTARFLGGRELQSDIVEALAQMPFDFVVNTAPGIAVDSFFAATDGGCEVAHYDRQGGAVRAVPDGTVDRPLVYHLFGSVEEPKSLVLSTACSA